MKLSQILCVLASFMAPVLVLGQLGNLGGLTEQVKGAANGGGDVTGATSGFADTGKVTGQVNGLLGGLGLNSLDLSQVLAIDWKNDKASLVLETVSSED